MLDRGRCTRDFRVYLEPFHISQLQFILL
jgi:hypothetical protein